MERINHLISEIEKYTKLGQRSTVVGLLGELNWNLSQLQPTQSALPTDQEIEQWAKEQLIGEVRIHPAIKLWFQEHQAASLIKEAGDSAIERKKLQDTLMAFIEFPHPHNEARGSIINRFLDEYLAQNNK